MRNIILLFLCFGLAVVVFHVLVPRVASRPPMRVAIGSGQAATAAAADEPTCRRLVRTFGIVPSQSWGSLPQRLRAVWASHGCDERVSRRFRERAARRGTRWIAPAVPPLSNNSTVVDIFWPGLGGVAQFRIPSLVSLGGASLIAFAEGRESVEDAGSIAIVYRSSVDGGMSWLPRDGIFMAKRASDLGDDSLVGGTLGNQVPIYLPATRTLLLIACSNGASATELSIRWRTVPKPQDRRVWLFRGRIQPDGSVAWVSGAREITRMVKRPEWTWYATGPGGGIVLANGSILIPANHAGANGQGEEGAGADSGDRSHLIVSHDSGVTWATIDGFAGPHTNEAAVAQLENGDVIVESRELFSGPRWMHVLPPTLDRRKDAFRLQSLIEPLTRGVHASITSVALFRDTGGGSSLPGSFGGSIGGITAGRSGNTGGGTTAGRSGNTAGGTSLFLAKTDATLWRQRLV